MYEIKHPFEPGDENPTVTTSSSAQSVTVKVRRHSYKSELTEQRRITKRYRFACFVLASIVVALITRIVWNG